MILIVTHKNDFTADFVINKLNDKGIEYYRLNCDDILQQYITVSIDSSKDISTIINANRAFDAVWFRRVSLPDINTENAADMAYMYSELESFYKGLGSL